MAKPIKETPVLRGKDAERFTKILEENESRRVSQQDYARAQSVYDKVIEKIRMK